MIKSSIPVIHGAAIDRPDEVDTILAAEAVRRSLLHLGFDSDVVVVSPGLEALDRVAAERPLLIFNLVEAVGGVAAAAIEFVQRLEALQLCFTGAGADAYIASTSKLATKAALARAGLPKPQHWRAGRNPPDDIQVIVKSVNEHGSFGMDHGSIVLGRDGADEIATREQRFGGEFFAEAFIDGREFNVSLIETRTGPLVLPIAEMDFSDLPAERPAIVDFAAKWDPSDISYRSARRSFGIEAAAPDLASEISRLALACWQTLGLSGYARIDFRVEADGTPLILEANANPCLTPDSGFVAAAREANFDYDDVIAAVIDSAEFRARVYV